VERKQKKYALINQQRSGKGEGEFCLLLENKFDAPPSAFPLRGQAGKLTVSKVSSFWKATDGGSHPITFSVRVYSKSPK
jgi:hypothetical protein